MVTHKTLTTEQRNFLQNNLLPFLQKYPTRTYLSRDNKRYRFSQAAMIIREILKTNSYTANDIDNHFILTDEDLNYLGKLYKNRNE